MLFKSRIGITCVWKSLLALLLVAGFFLGDPHISITSAQTEETKVTGTITYRERIALTPSAIVEVKLLDVSRADAPAITIEEQTIENPGQVPIDFEIEYDPDDIDDRFTYAVRASIFESGELAFTTDTRYSVITRDSPTHVDMVLVMVSGTPSEPSTPNVGGVALSNWLLAAMAVVGVILIALGMRAFIATRPNR